MTLLMLWITGSDPSILTIMFTVSMVVSPIKQVFTVNKGMCYKYSLLYTNNIKLSTAFSPFEHKEA